MRLQGIVWFVMALCFGCDWAPVASKTSQLATTRSEVSALAERVVRLENELRWVKLRDEGNTTAFLSPEKNGFEVVETSVGRFYVSLRGIAPYGDGFKVKVNIGNPQDATYENVKVEIKWGKRIPDTSFLNDDTAHTLEVPVYRKVRAGSWNPLDIVVAPASRDEVGALELKLQVPTVFLSTY